MQIKLRKNIRKRLEKAISRSLLSHSTVDWIPFEPCVHTNNSRANYLFQHNIKWKQRKKDHNIGVCIIKPARIMQFQDKKAKHQMAKRTPAILTKYWRPLKHADLAGIFTSKRQVSWNNILKATFQPISEKTYVLLPHSKGYNYYHWWADTVADLWYLQQAGIDLNEVDGIFMSYQQFPWQQEALQMCGISEDKIIPNSKMGLTNAAKLICPLRPRGSKLTPDWISRAMHDLTRWDHAKNSDSSTKKKIYISREDTSHRKIINEQVIIEFLHDKGFQTYQLAKLSIKEQQKLFASADVIFSPHGAGLINSVWCRPETVIADFIPYYLLNPCFLKLAEQCNLYYLPIVISNGLSYDDSGLNDLEIPIEYFKKALNILEKHRKPGN